MIDTFLKLFSVTKKETGFDEEKITEAEKRLSIKLPTELRHFYISKVKNKLINSCHHFPKPQDLQLYKSKWLPIYSENQGICFWAVNIEDFSQKQIPIYINFEEQGFEKETNNFNDFLILRASSDYSSYVYPHSMSLLDAEEKDVNTILEEFTFSNSDIQPKNYPRKRFFWRDENEVASIFEWNKPNYNGRKIINVVSMKKDIFEKYKNLTSSEKWQLRNSLTSRKHLASHFENEA